MCVCVRACVHVCASVGVFFWLLFGLGFLFCFGFLLLFFGGGVPSESTQVLIPFLHNFR